MGKSLPTGIIPTLGPDATGVGHVFWYTVEGQGYSLRDLRSIQDLLGHASLIFHSLQVPLQLVDRQVNESTLVLVTLALHAALIVLGTRLLSSGRRCHL